MIVFLYLFYLVVFHLSKNKKSNVENDYFSFILLLLLLLLSIQFYNFTPLFIHMYAAMTSLKLILSVRKIQFNDVNSEGTNQFRITLDDQLKFLTVVPSP